MPPGRPSSYNQKTCDEICNRLALGESLRTICKSDNLPSLETVLQWVRKYPDFSEQYARAREDQQDYYAEEILEIANDQSRDTIDSGDGKTYSNSAAVQRDRLRVDSLKWIMSKLAPKKYGDKLQTELTGKDGQEIVVNVNISEKTK